MSVLISKIWTDLSDDLKLLTLRKIGPLAHLVGVWSGTGYSIISRPDPSNKDRPFFFQQNTTIEQMAFVPLIAPVLNRSAAADQENIFLKGLMYEHLVLDSTDIKNVLHFEVGQWLWVQETTDPPNKASIVRQANILHGASFLAIGDSPAQTPVDGRPNIEKLDTTPIGPNVDQDYLKQITCTALPQGIPEGSKENPIVFLTHRLDTQRVIDQVTFSVSATIPTAEASNRRNELMNIPFLDKHAEPRELRSNFYVEHIEDHATATNSSMQLQYGQRVILRFIGIDWPHVSVGTLKRHGL